MPDFLSFFLYFQTLLRLEYGTKKAGWSWCLRVCLWPTMQYWGFVEGARDFKARSAAKEHANAKLEVRSGGRDPGISRPGAGLGQSPTRSKLSLCVFIFFCFIKPILGNHYVRSRGFIVSEPRETHPRSEITDVPTLPCPPLDNLWCPDPYPPP